MRLKSILSLFIILCIIHGCAAYDPERSIVNMYFHPKVVDEMTVYSDRKMLNPASATVVRATNEGLPPTTTEIVMYEISALGGGVLQFIDPNFSLSYFPMQKITIKYQDGSEANILYPVLADYPHTFRKDDNVTVDINASKAIVIRPAFVNPQNIDDNKSVK